MTHAEPFCTDLVPVLVDLAMELWSTTLAAPSQVGRERLDRMRKPEFGDLVLVVYTKRDEDPHDRIGRYDAVWSHIHHEDGEEWHETPIYGIELLDGRYVKWTNVDLVALPVAFPSRSAPTGSSASTDG